MKKYHFGLFFLFILFVACIINQPEKELTTDMESIEEKEPYKISFKILRMFNNKYFFVPLQKFKIK